MVCSRLTRRPGVTFHCNVNEDPFLSMEQNNKTYGFNIAISEIRASIPTLWDTVKGTS